jgi:hypothetical protein
MIKCLYLEAERCEYVAIFDMIETIVVGVVSPGPGSQQLLMTNPHLSLSMEGENRIIQYLVV